eukprot:scaffold5281_cov127-Cylindrotheca_fusiformis.AAC.14
MVHNGVIVVCCFESTYDVFADVFKVEIQLNVIFICDINRARRCPLTMSKGKDRLLTLPSMTLKHQRRKKRPFKER